MVLVSWSVLLAHLLNLLLTGVIEYGAISFAMILILIIINDFFLDFDCDFLSFGGGLVFVQCVVDSLVVVFEIFDVEAVLGEFEVFYDEGADLEGTQGDVLFELFVEDVVLLGKGDHLFPVPFGG